MHPDPMTLAIIIRTTVTMFAILAAVQLMLIPTLVEEFRQDLFRTRRQLFMLVADGQVEPNARPYVSIRRTINGFLRFAERVTVSRLALAALLRDGESRESYEQRVAEEFEDVPEKTVRDELIGLRTVVAICVLKHLLIATPVLWPLLLLVRLVFLAWDQGRVLARGWFARSDGLAVIEAEAEYLGSDSMTDAVPAT